MTQDLRVDENDLPEGWAKTALGEVAAAKLGKMLDKAKNVGTPTPYLRNINVRWLWFDLDDLLTIRVRADEFDKFAIHDGDVLICEGGEPGRAAVWRGGNTGVVFQKAIHRVRLLGGILPEWLVYRIKYDADSPRLETYFTGSTIKHLTGNSLKKYSFSISPLAEQKRIVAKVASILRRVNIARAHLARTSAILERFRQAVLAAACSGRLTEDLSKQHRKAVSEEANGDLPDGWSRIALDTLCEGFQYGTSAKSAKAGRIPVLRMGNIQDGRLDWADLAFTSDKTEISKYRLKPDTVLFNRTNSPELVGKTAIYCGERPAIFAGYLIRILHGPKLNPHYLNICLNEPAFKEYCLQVRTDGVSQSNINARKLAEYRIPWCKLDEQAEIVRRVAALFRLADEIETRVAAGTRRADKLTQGILAKAFRGELVPTEAELARREGRSYETAEALLARIRAQRTAGTSPNNGRLHRASARQQRVAKRKPARKVRG